MLAIRLPDEVERRLAELAHKTRRTKTFYAREAIPVHLEDLEDRYLIEERLPAPAKRWPHEDPEAEVDLERSVGQTEPASTTSSVRSRSMRALPRTTPAPDAPVNPEPLPAVELP